MSKEFGVLCFFGFMALSMAPIWRCAAGWQGMNLWEYARLTMIQGLVVIEHVPIEEAIVNARLAYCEVMGLDYNEQTYEDPPIGSSVSSSYPGVAVWA